MLGQELAETNGLDNRVQQDCKFIRDSHLQKQYLEQELQRITSRIDNYDGINPI
jgi:hypothetical protein